MHAREVTLHLQPNSESRFTQTIEKDVMPLLRTQHGFKDEITFIVPGGAKAVAISLWDRKESAEAYDRATYPQVLKTLVGIIAGTPQVETYEVSNSTWHKIAVQVPA